MSAHHRSLAWIAVAAGVAAALPAARAQAPGSTPGPGGIYSCVDANGRRLTSDRPIPDCIGREQRVLGPDGSLRKTLPPSLTADERAAREARERQEALEAAGRRDAVRRDRNLMARFPNEAAHRAARGEALLQLQRAMGNSQQRLQALAAERKPLLDEAEFYVGKPLPFVLKQRLDANDAATAAQHEVMKTQRAEIDRVNALFDLELERLRRLWAGAPPGSLGPPAQSVAPVARTGTASPAGR